MICHTERDDNAHVPLCPRIVAVRDWTDEVLHALEPLPLGYSGVNMSATVVGGGGSERGSGYGGTDCPSTPHSPAATIVSPLRQAGDCSISCCFLLFFFGGCLLPAAAAGVRLLPLVLGLLSHL